MILALPCSLDLGIVNEFFSSPHSAKLFPHTLFFLLHLVSSPKQLFISQSPRLLLPGLVHSNLLTPPPGGLLRVQTSLPPISRNPSPKGHDVCAPSPPVKFC